MKFSSSSFPSPLTNGKCQWHLTTSKAVCNMHSIPFLATFFDSVLREFLSFKSTFNLIFKWANFLFKGNYSTTVEGNMYVGTFEELVDTTTGVRLARIRPISLTLTSILAKAEASIRQWCRRAISCWMLLRNDVSIVSIVCHPTVTLTKID